MHLDITTEQLGKLMSYPDDQAVQMLNLLKFKEEKDDNGKTGAELYQDYMVAATPFFGQVEAKIIFVGHAKLNLIGPEALEWDKILIIEYTNKQEFMKMISLPGYPAKMRNAALLDSRLVLCSID